MTRQSYDVIVIGSGPGGLSCATLLQKRGIATLLVEKNGFLGGKMVSVKKDGYAYDLFPHGQVPMRQPAFESIFEELGVGNEFQPALQPDDTRDVIKICYRRRDWKNYKLAAQSQAMADASPFFRLWEIDAEAQQKTIAIMAEIATMPDEQVDELDNVSMHEFLARHDTPDALYSYMAFHANASLAEPIDLVAASEQIRILKQIMLQGGGGQYKGGFGMLTDVMAREFEKNGGDPRPQRQGRADHRRGRRRHRRDDDEGCVHGAGRGEQRRHPADRPQAGGRAALRSQLPELHQRPGTRLGLHQHPLLPQQAGHGRAHVRRLLGRQLVEHGALPAREGRPDSRRGHPLHVQPFLLRRGGGAAGQAGLGLRHHLLTQPRSRRDRGIVEADGRADGEVLSGDLGRHRSARSTPDRATSAR